MRAYWAEGHNQSYILLRILVERRQVMTTLAENDEEIASQQASQQEEEEDAFSKSFENRGKKIWSTLMAPYQRDDEDVNEFITDDIGIEDGEEIIQRPVFEKPEADLEDQFVEHLRKKRLDKKHGYDSSSNEEDDSSSSEDISIGVNDSDSDYEGNVEEEVESEDEWVTKKRTKAKPSWKNSKKPLTRKTTRLQKSIINDDDDDDDDDNDMFSANEGVLSKNKNGHEHKGTFPEEDDSGSVSSVDDTKDDEDFVPSSAVKTRRKQQIFSSDEE